MINSNIKCVLVIDKYLPLDLIANTAAILGCSLNDCVEGIVEEYVLNKSNFVHKGIINIPLYYF